MTKENNNKTHERNIMDKGYGLIPKSIMIDTNLSIEAKAIYAYLASYSGSGNKSFPGVETMLYHLDISKKRYYKYRKELIDNGYIKIEQTRETTEKGLSVRGKNVYVLEQKITIKLSECDENEDENHETVENTDVSLCSQFETVQNETVQNETVQNETVQNYHYNRINSNVINSYGINSFESNSSKINDIKEKNIKKENEPEEVETISSGEDDIYKSIVDYLNLKTGSKYRPNSKKTKSFIKARLNEGYVLDNFKTVIDNKCESWIGTKYEQYLRPETLFGNKFEGYLNEKHNDNTQPKKTYTTNVPNKNNSNNFENVKSEYVPDYKKNFNPIYHDPKSHANFEISDTMKQLTTNSEFASEFENKALGFDEFDEDDDINPFTGQKRNTSGIVCKQTIENTNQN